MSICRAGKFKVKADSLSSKGPHHSLEVALLLCLYMVKETSSPGVSFFIKALDITTSQGPHFPWIGS